MNLSEEDFLNKVVPPGTTPEEVGIEPLNVINDKLKDIMPRFSKRGLHPKEYTVLGVDYVQDYEGIVQVASVSMLPPGEKKLSRKRGYIVIGDILPGVITPIVIKTGNEAYVVLCSQDRMPLGGKVSIEVYRGSVPAGTEPRKLSLNLVERKIPNLPLEANLLEVRDLGYYWNNTGISGVITPIQALFYVMKNNLSPEELKKVIKPELGLDIDPKEGPVLHSTSPVIRTLAEVEERLKEVQRLDYSTDIDKPEAYLNDMFSMTGILMLLRSIDSEGMPF